MPSTQLGSIVDETLAKSGLKKEDVDWLIPHQANSRIIEATAQRLNLPMERVILTVAEHGNTSAASVPLALDHALKQDKIKHGEILMLEAFGAGLAWGSHWLSISVMSVELTSMKKIAVVFPGQGSQSLGMLGSMAEVDDCASNF